MTDRTPTTEAEPDVRHVKMYRDLWDPAMPGIMLRSWDGQAIGIDWGEPDAEGWYSPTFRVSGSTEAERLDEARAPLVAIRGKLEQLRDHGYQPMYNGRPSCPFCTAFIDYEMTHYTDCSLVAALSRENQP